MGKRGPTPKPPSERKLDGNPSHRPIPVELFVPEGAPFVPDHLSEDAQACAEHILKSFPTKHIAATDSYALAAFATAWAWHKCATHLMNAPDFQPLITGSTGQLVPNPWFKIQAEQSRLMLVWAAKLHLTPADRMQVRGAGQPEPVSKFAGLIAQPASSTLSKN